MSPSEYRELTILIANEFARAREEFRAFFLDQLDRCQQEFHAHLMRDRESLWAGTRLLVEEVRQGQRVIE